MAGSGIYLAGRTAHLRHVTLARNDATKLAPGGAGSGLYITGAHAATSSVFLTNTILVSHTVGITVAAGNTATLEATLWGTDTWANLSDWGGVGTIITGTANSWGDPAFTCVGTSCVAPYRIGPGSAALDAGVDTGLRIDIDHEPRPYQAPDLGADEYWPPGTLNHLYLPLVLRNYR
jgi:hypothetical protein